MTTIAFLMMIFIFVLGNLIFNLENLYIGPEAAPDFVGGGGAAQGGNVAANSTLADAIRFVWFGILGVVFLAIVAGVYSFTKSDDKRKWRNLMVQLTGFTLICVILTAALLSYDSLDITPNDEGNPTLSEIGGGSGNSSSDQNDTIGTPSGMKIVWTFGIFLVIFALIVTCILGVEAIIQMKGERHRRVEREKVQDAAEAIQHAIDTLYEGTDTRSTIIRCYDDLCKVMEKHGVFEKEHLTPREFELLVKKALPVSGLHLHNLVLVFEEARYSEHALSEIAGRKALLCLEKVKDDLTKENDNDA
jgi:hypothetical protein